METTFHYRRIGPQFDQELQDLVEDGKSAVLLGVRHIGKSYVLRRIGVRLKDENRACLVEIDFPGSPVIHEAHVVADLVGKAVSAAKELTTSETCHSPEPDLEITQLLAPLKKLCDERSRTVILFASNVDSLSQHLSQAFLRETRGLVQHHGLTAVLTGEENLKDLVYGDDSEFNCADQFVIEGFERSEFSQYMSRRHEVTAMRFLNVEASLQRLFAFTGGNPFLARAVLWVWLERLAQRSEHHPEPPPPLSDPDFQSFLESEQLITTLTGMGVFQDAIRLVRRSPKSWKDIRQLQRGERPEMHGDVPATLELAGLAARDQRRLQFVAPIVERFVHTYYDLCRLGDLHAVAGDWESAFRYYRKLPPTRRLRPNGAEDRTHLSLVLNALIAEIHAVATRTQESQDASPAKRLELVKQLFREGCELVLGIESVNYWSTFNGNWEPSDSVHAADYTPNIDILRKVERNRMGWQQPDYISKNIAIAVLPSLRPDQRDAVVISQPMAYGGISRERMEIFRQLLEQFAIVYDHAISTWGISERLNARQRHLEVATGIVNALGETVQNPGDALKMAGEQLLKLGNQRIMFSLVDPERTRITGICQCVAEACSSKQPLDTVYSLSHPSVDVQPWVVTQGKAVVVPDWKRWDDVRGDLPPVNKVLCRAVQMGPFAIVPMLIRHFNADGTWEDLVYGTMHVEPTSRLAPSDDDVNDLLEFGRQLAVAVNQAERIHALLEVLKKDPAALVIVNNHRNVRYVNNETSEKRFGILRGWHQQPERFPSHEPESETDQFNTALRHVIQTGKRHVYYSAATSAESRQEEFVYEPISDWREKFKNPDNQSESSPSVLGAVLRVRDLTPLNRVFEALRIVAGKATDRDSCSTAIIECVQHILPRSHGQGNPRPRLYRVDPKFPEDLISSHALGLPPDHLSEFNSGFYRMKRTDDEDDYTWRCIDNQEPCVYCWDPAIAKPAQQLSEHGLTVNAVTRLEYQGRWKQAGDVWIDLPLVANRRVFGKLSIDCGQGGRCTLTPEELELLKLFSALLGALLDALDQQERWVNAAAERAMATCAHSIRTKLAALSGFEDWYRRGAPGNAEIADLLAIHGPLVSGALRSMDRILETFGREIQLKPIPVEVAPFVKNVLSGLSGFEGRERSQQTILEHVCPANVVATLDEDRLREALEELVRNSHSMADPLEELKIQIEVSARHKGNSPWLRFIVRDNGPGIDDDCLPKVFDPLYSKRRHGEQSTGLGLNRVKRIVEAHGGTLHIARERGWSVSFIMDLPAEPRSAS